MWPWAKARVGASERGAYGRVYVGFDRLTQMQAMGIAAKLSRDGRRDGSMDGSRDGHRIKTEQGWAEGWEHGWE